MGMTEQVDGYNVTFEERCITATRRFLDEPENEGTDELPTIGQEFSDPIPGGVEDVDYSTLLCRRIEKKAFSTDKRIAEYICTYSNEPTDRSQFSNGSMSWNELPQSMEFAGEYNTMDQPAAGWTWDRSESETEDVPVIVPIPYRIQTQTIKISRIVNEANYSSFIDIVQQTLGCVNDSSDSPPGQGGVGCWLFSSCTSEPFYGYDGTKRYKAELIFTYRNPDDQDEANANRDGWQKVLRPEGYWGIPKDKNGDKIYKEANFDNLFTGE